MPSKLLQFIQVPFYEKIIFIGRVWAKIKTYTIYRLALKSIGRKCLIHKPLLFKNAKFISIGSNVFIRDHVRLECIVQKNSTIIPHLIVESGVSIEQRGHITVGNELIIGKDTIISFDVMITDIDHEYRNLDIPIGKQDLLIKKTQIGDNCFIGSGAKIQAGTILGRHCIIGANAVVRGVFPSFCVIAGVPAKIIKRYNEASYQWEKTNERGEFIHEI